MSRKLRVISLFAVLDIGGDTSRLLAFSRVVDKTRIDHTVLSIVQPEDEGVAGNGLMLPRFQQYGIQVESLGEASRVTRRKEGSIIPQALRDIAAFVRIVWRLMRYFRKHEPDIIDARQGYAVLFGVIAGRLAKVPVIVATEYGPEFWRPPFWYLAGQFAFTMADALISDSQCRIDAYQRWLLRHHRRAVVIPNGIFPPTTKRTREEMRREFALPENPEVRVIGQISRLIPYKGQRVLIDAARRVIEQEPNTAFLICGYPHFPGYVDELQRQALDLGIADRVRIVSYPGPVGDVWAAIDIHAHASLYDSAPIAIHESMTLGLPAVVTRVGGIPDLVQDGMSGLVVPPDDPEAFAMALLRLLRDPAFAHRLGAAARCRYESNYRAEIMENSISELFAHLFTCRRRFEPEAVDDY